MRIKKKTQGFTLIELLIVIAIILILIAIALPNFLEAQVRARVARVKADLRSLSIAMESYFIQYAMYPPDNDPSENTLGSIGLRYLTTPIQFIASVPSDVFNQQNSGVATEEPGFEMASTGQAMALVFIRGKPKVNAYVIHSHGPARQDRFGGGNDDWPCGGPPPINPCAGGLGWWDYSPTNGTNSSGEITQLGGEHRSGNYCIDGWNLIRGFYPPQCPF